MLSLRPFLDQLTIKTTKNELKPFDLNYVDPELGDWGWAQRPFISEIERQHNLGLPVRIIVLKARQLGISTATEATLFIWSFLYPGSNGLVISHQDGQAQELFQMTKNFWEFWPHRFLYTLQYSTKRQLRWYETKSQVRIATAKNIESVRGSTIQALHASEVAFWPDGESLWGGMKPAIHNRKGTLVVLESTANGVGNFFHDLWLDSKEGVSEYIPMFFPWYVHPSYRMATTLSSELELDAEERRYLKLFQSPTSLSPYHTVPGLTLTEAYTAIAWRRWAIINMARGDLLWFMQEYPATDEEAFIATGKPIFSPLHLRDCFDERTGVRGYLYRNGVGKVEFVADASGNLTVFKRPRLGDQRTDRFFVAGDPAETIPGDPGCIQVIDRATLEQVAVWHGKTTPVHFAKEMMLVGDFFNHAMLCPEIEGGGQACIGYIIAAGYDNLWGDKRADRIKGSSLVYGWSTNWQRKQWAVGWLQRYIVDHSITIHDRKTYHQLMRFVEQENGEWCSDPKTHDDAVMALAIAVTASAKEGMYMPNPAASTNPIFDIYQQEFLDPIESLYERAGTY